MAAEPVFIDTNVLVYISRPNAQRHAVARAVLGRLEVEGNPLWISAQVMREYLAVVIRQQSAVPPIPIATALGDVRRFRRSFEIANDSPAVLDRLLRLLAAHPSSGKQVHDANLAATMLTHGIRRLLTFNTADFRRFGTVIHLEPWDAP